MKVAVVKYNAGNVQSLGFALNRLGIDPEVTDDPQVLKTSDRVIFPGQGEASSAMTYLKKKGLQRIFKDLSQPFLGICLGMQLMCRYLQENNTEGLGLIPANVKRFGGNLKMPHMGWNQTYANRGSLMEGVENNSYLYFAHSYFVEICPQTVSRCDYGVEFSTALQKDNFFAIQAHPEKSTDTGLKILSNFLASPSCTSSLP